MIKTPSSDVDNVILEKALKHLLTRAQKDQEIILNACLLVNDAYKYFWMRCPYQQCDIPIENMNHHFCKVVIYQQ